MSYHGLGQVMRFGAPSTPTSRPGLEFKKIEPKMDPHEYLRKIGFKVTTARVISPPQQPKAPIASSPGHHRAPPALPANYSREAMGCHGKMAVPINPGKPGYPGFLCVSMKPLVAKQIYPMIKAFTGGSVSPTGGGRVDLNVKPSARGNKPINRFKVDPPGAHAPGTQPPAGSVDATSFASACSEYGGTLGTPNCCAFPDGTKLGLDRGRLVEVLQCDVKKGGLGGNLPLIAGAAVIALLVARGL